MTRLRPAFLTTFAVSLLLSVGLAHAGKWTRHTIGGGGAECAIAVDPRDSRVAYVTTDLGGILKTVNGGGEWFPINNNIGNSDLYDIELDPLNPDIVYVCAALQRTRASWTKTPPNGELYRSRDGGVSWENVWSEGEGRRSFGIRSASSQIPNLLILRDPRNPRQYDRDGDRLSDVIVVGGYDMFKGEPADVRSGIWKSIDEGATFKQVALHRLSISGLYQDPDNPRVLYAGTVGNGLWRSKNEGATWDRFGEQLARHTVYDVIRKPGTGIIFACTSRGLQKSVDNGTTFERTDISYLFGTKWHKEHPAYQAKRILFDNQDPSRNTLVVALMKRNSWIKLIRSTDGGATWKREAAQSIAGIPWFEKGPNGPVYDLQQGRDGRLYGGCGRTALVYNPTKARWDISANGVGNIVIYELAFEPGNPSTVYLGMGDSGPWKSVDKGKTWQYIGDGFASWGGVNYGQATQFAISPAAPNVLYGVGYTGNGRHQHAYQSVFCKSTEGGKNWQVLTNGLPATSHELNKGGWKAKGVVVSPTNPDIACVALHLRSGGGAIYRTTDGGAHWTQVHKMGVPNCLSISRKGEVVVCAVAGKAVHLGRNCGATWQESAEITGGWLQQYAVDIAPSDPDRICVGVNLKGAYLTRDGGKSWTHMLTRADLEPFVSKLALSERIRSNYHGTVKSVTFDPTDPDTLYLAPTPSSYVGLGILKTTDAGKTWTQFSDQRLFLNKIRTIGIDEKGHNLVAAGLEAYYYHHGDANR